MKLAGFYMADLETTTDPKDCRCWAWASVPINSPNIESTVVNNSIETLIKEWYNKPGIYYFHNLRFDGGFILDWLFRHGYKWFIDSKRLRPGEFSSLISDMGSWYTLKIHLFPDEYGNEPEIEIRDSLKLIPLSVEEIPDAYGLENISKLKIDYNEYREPGHKLTEIEEAYVKVDVVIVAQAIKFMFEQNQNRLTAGSNALNDYKHRIGIKQFNKWFPELDPITDKDVRLSYKGGWTYLNPKYKNLDIGEGTVFDVNSMYPWAMKYCKLPYGEAVYFSGKYEPSKVYDLYVINILCEFTIKPNHYPSIQIKNSFKYQDNEYLTHSDGPTRITLTCIDFELFLFNYDVDIIEYNGGYMWKSRIGMFTEYVNYWFGVKTDAKKSKNKGMEKIAKLMLNSLYGKFGAKLFGKSKIPYFDTEQDKVRYKLPKEKEKRKGGYLPVATFITSYCRDKINRGAYACGDDFIYADTDSLHIKGNKVPEGLDVDEFRLGAFKVEERFKRARFIRQKTYLEIFDAVDVNGNPIEKKNLKCCGMPRAMQASVPEEAFKEGAIFDPTNPLTNYAPKLVPRVVPGGVILRETTFQIKKAKTVNAY